VSPLWTGASSTDGHVENWSDYGRACAVEGYIGVIALGQRQSLVLGDEPAMTTYLPAERLLSGGRPPTKKSTW
jgi:hypothetical protein